MSHHGPQKRLLSALLVIIVLAKISKRCSPVTVTHSPSLKTIHNMSNESVVWKCHPDLEAEWVEFVNDSRKAVRNDLNSDLWMNFWRSEVPSSGKTTDVTTASIPLQESEELIVCKSSPHFKEQLSEECEEMQVELPLQEAILSESQVKQLKSITCELIDTLDMPCENFPEDVKDDVRFLSRQETEFLLKELKSKLSDQGVYTFCSLLTEDAGVEPWTNVSLVFKVLFLDKLTEDGFKSCNQELAAGLKQLTEYFPSECVTSFLKPLLASDLPPPYLQLITGLIPSLPERDFSSLLGHIVLACKAPLEEQQISTINCLLSGGRANIFEGKSESPLLDLLPILSASARILSASESFATLLLKVIPSLKKNASPKIQNELVAIVQLNTSFNNRALLDALSS